MKKLFSYNSEIEKNAYLNWRMSEHSSNNGIWNLEVLGSGYLTAAKMLVQSLLNCNVEKNADSVIFPILFTINHSIEVYLKICLILDDCSKNKEPKTNINHHDIGKLYCELKKRESDSKEFNKFTKKLREYIEEITNLVHHEHEIPKEDGTSKTKSLDGMDFSRHTIDVYNNPYFYTKTEENITVDLENLIEIIDNLSECLESLYNYYWYRAFPEDFS